MPLLDRAGPRRAISFGAAIGRAVVCLYAAPRFGTLLLFPCAFLLLVLSKVHAITKNGLAVAYAGPNEGLVRANARLGRIAAGGAVLAAGPAFALLKLGRRRGRSCTARPSCTRSRRSSTSACRTRSVTGGQAEVSKRGAIPQLTAPAIGAAGLRAASGFLLFALAFALRRSGEPTWWFAVLAGSATAGAFLGDLIAPRLPAQPARGGRRDRLPDRAGVGAMLSFFAFELVVLVLFATVVGASSELGRLAFQTLMQRLAPGGAHGRVFVRYEILFQLAWVGGAFIPALAPIDFREGFLILAALYLVAIIGYLTPDILARRRG